MKTYDFELELQVRDYECDIQGIVNNAVYQNYLEHCRHQFLNYVGLDFAGLHNDGIDAVVIRAEIDYKFPLLPGDAFYVQLQIAKKGRLRIIFNQQIIRKRDGHISINFIDGRVSMKDIILFFAIIAVWVFLQAYILPKLGVST